MGTVNFDPTGNGVDSKTTGDSVYPWFFLTKINSDGTYGYTYVWNDSKIGVFDLKVDLDNNIYAAGSISEETGGSNLDPTGGSDIVYVDSTQTMDFYLKFDSDGVYQYSKQLYGTSSGSIWLNNMTIDSNNNVYLFGSFSVEMVVTGTADLKISNGDRDIYLSQFDSNGDYQATYTIGGIGLEQGQAMGNDQNNNIYILGAFNDTVNFDPTGGLDSKTASFSGQLFITKINNDGTYAYTQVWDNTNITPSKIAFDSSNKIYIFGTYVNTANFDPTGEDHSATSSGSDDIYMTVLNGDQTYGYTYTWGGTDDDSIYDASFNSSDNLYIVGYTSSPSVDYDPTAGVNTIALKGNEDGFVMELEPGAPVVPPVTEDNNNQSPSATINGPVSCTSPIPVSPTLFQIWATNNHATIYFVPTISPSSGYTVSYGLYANAEMYNASFNYADKSGAIPYTINYLNSDAKYYFKVRANNGCMPGEWSNTLSVTVPASQSGSIRAYSNTPSAPSDGSCSLYAVQPGDSLWAIAQKLLGNGTKYLQVILSNVGNYPSLNSSTIIHPNWNLSVGC